METNVTSELLLRVYQRAINHGERLPENGYRFYDLTVTVEPDGYSIGVSDGVVTARVLFHNKVAITGGTSRSLAVFRKKLEAATNQDRTTSNSASSTSTSNAR